MEHRENQYQKELEKLRAQVLKLEQLLSITQKSLAKGTPQKIDAPNIDAASESVGSALLSRELQSGLYVLETEIELARVKKPGTFKEKFTVYHLSAPVSYDGQQWQINVGLAIAGLTTSPQFYLDYDSDRHIDAKIMYELVSFVPLAGAVTRSLNEDNSQKVYDTFLKDAKVAKFTSLNDIQKEGGKMGNALLNFVTEQTERIAKFISSENGTK